MRRTGILVVDDSVTMRAMIETLLERDGWLEVVGIAGEATQVLDLIDETDPDVVTLDIRMPGVSGLELLDTIMAKRPRPVVMLSSLTVAGDPICAEAMRRGAAGCFDKSRLARDIAGLINLIKQADTGLRVALPPVLSLSPSVGIAA